MLHPSADRRCKASLRGSKDASNIAARSADQWSCQRCIGCAVVCQIMRQDLRPRWVNRVMQHTPGPSTFAVLLPRPFVPLPDRRLRSNRRKGAPKNFSPVLSKAMSVGREFALTAMSIVTVRCRGAAQPSRTSSAIQNLISLARQAMRSIVERDRAEQALDHIRASSSHDIGPAGTCPGVQHSA